MRTTFPGVLLSLSLVFVPACASAPDSLPHQYLHERIMNVHPGQDGRTLVGFEFSARNYAIDPNRSADAKAMVAFAEAARKSGKRVYATFDPVSNEPKSMTSTAGPAILLRLADTPDPEPLRR